MEQVITITLSAEQMERLRQKAQQLRVAPEALVRATLVDLLERPDEAFQRALTYVVHKNRELYRRLAAAE